MSKLAFVLSISLFLIPSCEKEHAAPLPDAYPLTEFSLHPESFVYSPKQETVYVGAYFKGKILSMDLFGNRSDFITDESLVAVVGMAIDEQKNILWVCNSDAGISQRSDPATIGQLTEVIAYDLTTGTKLKTIDLSTLFVGGHFLNDLVLDKNGNIYVTDSFSPVIYKIDQNDNSSVLISDPIFEVPQGAFGLNGIVYHPDGYLIVGKSFGGILYKVPLSDPGNVQEITLNASVNSIDGLLLMDNNTLALVSNNFTGAAFEEAVYKIESTDGWLSGHVRSSFKTLDGIYPTSLEMINNGLFVTFGYFPELVDPNAVPHDDFKLQKVQFSN